MQNFRGVVANEVHGIMGDVKIANCRKLTLHEIKVLEMNAT